MISRFLTCTAISFGLMSGVASAQTKPVKKIKQPPKVESPMTKALDGDGGLIKFICAYLAKPQGFAIEVITKEYNDGSRKTFYTVDAVTPGILSDQHFNQISTDPLIMPRSEPLGNQTSTVGVHPFGGFAHNSSNALIIGSVYHVIGHKSGPTYSGGRVTSEALGGTPSGNCTSDLINHAISRLNSFESAGVPQISAGSRAYNNIGYDAGSPGNPGSVHGDWVGDLHEAHGVGFDGTDWLFHRVPSSGIQNVDTETAAPADGVAPAPPVNHNTVRQVKKRG